MRRSDLTRLFRRGEHEKLDFKSALRIATRDEKAKLVKHVLAIANTRGDVGHLLFGIDDSGNESGLLDATITEEQIQRVIREYCDPYVTTTYEVVHYREADVGVLTIRREAHKLPYHPARDIGFGGAKVHRHNIFIRHGRHSEIATVDEVQSLVGEGGAARFALQRRLRQMGPVDEYGFLLGEERQQQMRKDLHDVCKELELPVTELGDKVLLPSIYVLKRLGRKRVGILLQVLFYDLNKGAVAATADPPLWELRRYALTFPSRLVHIVLVYPGIKVAPIKSFAESWSGIRNTAIIREGDNYFYSSRRSIPVLWIGHVTGREIMKRKLEDGLSWIAEHGADIWR